MIDLSKELELRLLILESANLGAQIVKTKILYEVKEDELGSGGCEATLEMELISKQLEIMVKYNELLYTRIEGITAILGGCVPIK